MKRIAALVLGLVLSVMSMPVASARTGPVLAKDVNPGDGASDPSGFVTLGKAVYFTAFDPEVGRELFQTKKTKKGFVTKLVKDIDAAGSADPRGLTVFKGALYFSAFTPTSGREVWRSDGTAKGTHIVKDMNPNTSGSGPLEFAQMDDMLYFVQDFGGFSVICKTDGTAIGTSLVTGDDVSDPEAPSDLTAVGSTLFFYGGDATNGFELWKSTGTFPNTEIVKNIAPGADDSVLAELTSFAGKLYFDAYDDSDVELWMSDGSGPGTQKVTEIAPGALSSSPAQLTVIGSRLFFSATDGSSGIELFSTDGTGPGTGQVQDIQLGSGSSNPTGLTEFGGALFYGADDGTHGVELWKSDGTPNDASLVADLNPSGDGFLGAAIGASSKFLYFAGTDSYAKGDELARSNGTSAGTVFVKDIDPGADSSQPAFGGSGGSFICFSAGDGAHGREPWCA